MNTVAFIFARGGSKGLQGKNLRLLDEKPLIAWSIEHAQSIERIERIIVSTDSEDIASVALDYGAEVPFLRPADLATDESPEILSWRHGLDFLEKSSGKMPETFISIPTTAPLRLPVDLENCLDEYAKNESDIVVTITDAHRNPFFNMVQKNPDGTYRLVNNLPTTVTRRQNAPMMYDLATVCYVANSKFIMSHDSIFEGRVKAVHIPIERAIDIDSMLDFQIAEALLSIRGGTSDQHKKP